MSRNLYPILLFALAICAEVLASDEVVPAGALANKELSALLAELDHIRESAGVAGAGLAIVSREKVLHVGGFGVQSRETMSPATRDTLFRVGSITKSFVGLTSLQMLRSQPDLFDQSVNSTIPDLLGEEFGGNTVRLPHLLEHTAGLGDLSAREFAFQGETVTFEKAVDYDPGTRKLRWQAGAHSSYSNAGFGFAGYVLEAAGKRPFEELVKHYVLNPVQMENAGFFITEDSPPLAAGYNTDGKTPIPYWHMLYRSFGGLNATPVDMSRFVRALLQHEGPGQLFLNVDERKRFENPSTTLAAGTGLPYGYGLGNYHWFSNDLRFHGHGGDADGYLSHYGYSTDAGYGYFVVITAFNKKPLNEMRSKIERYLASLPELGTGTAADRQLEASGPLALPRERLIRLAGNYEEVSRRFASSRHEASPALRVTIKNAQLQTDYRGRQLPLVAVSEQHFKRPWQPAASYAFITTESGDVYLQGDMGNFRRLKSAD